MDDQMIVDMKNKKVSLVGIHTIVVAVLVVALTWMGYLLKEAVDGTKEAIREAVAEQTKQQSAEHLAMTEEFRHSFGQMNLNQGRMVDAMNEQTFLMTKTDAERKLFRLDMPDSFRKRIR